MRPFIESWPCYNESCSHIDGVITMPATHPPPLSRLPKYAPALNLICLGFVSLSGQVASKKPELQRKIQLGWPLWGACLRGRRSPPRTRCCCSAPNCGLPYPSRHSSPANWSVRLFWTPLGVGYPAPRYRRPQPNDVGNYQQRTGVGLGLTWGRPDDFMIRSYFAWRLTEPSTTGTSTGYPQIYFALSKLF